MEKEDLTRSLALLESRGVNLDCIVTDRHPQVQKFLRERNITHYYDVWHFAKGIFSEPIWSYVLLQPFPFFDLLVISFWLEGPDVWKLA